MKLADLQQSYRRYLLSGDSGQLASAIVADAFDGAERLGIYRNNFLIGLTEALKTNFPVTLQMVGTDFFEQAARRFVLTHPPCGPCLFEYGARFPDYLRGLPQLSALAYVAEVARFEFARIAAYNAPAERALDAQLLAALTSDRLAALPIRRARHARLVWSDAPVLALWTAHQMPEPDLSNIDMATRRHALLVCRPDRALLVRELALPDAQFLAAAGEAASFGEVAAQSGAAEAALGAIIAMALDLRLLVVDAVEKLDRLSVEVS